MLKRLDHPLIDEVSLAIIEGKLIATTEEMAIIIRRSSMSPIVYEVLDYSCGICDADGELIAQSLAITLFSGTFKRSVRGIIDKFGKDVGEGDVFLLNDPYSGGGSHLNDAAVVQPVFVDGVLTAYSISIAHLTEVGGMVPGSLSPAAVEIFQEGIRFPGVRLYRSGVKNQDVFDIIASNVRLPEMTLTDLTAEVVAVGTGARRIGDICSKYGRDKLVAAFAAILHKSEAQSRKAVTALPDGVYRATGYIDGTGLSNEQLPVVVVVTIKGDEIIFDFTGSCGQRPGACNGTLGALLSSVKTVFKALVGPHEPSNEGWFRPITVIAPEGSIFNAAFPAPVGWYFEATIMASELIWKALAPVAGDRLGAGHYMSASVVVFHGETEAGERFVLVEPHQGGWGASRGQDGTAILCPSVDGDTQNYSIELLEARQPIVCRRYTFNTADGVGHGTWRGGFGAVREYEILCENAHVYGSLARSVEPPWGVEGGSAGTSNYFVVNGENIGPRVRDLVLKRGDRVAIVTGGGGGYGPPVDRRAEQVLADFRDELISKEDAISVYGVETDLLLSD